jgi:parallel beta-helix repeat protein
MFNYLLRIAEFVNQKHGGFRVNSFVLTSIVLLLASPAWAIYYVKTTGSDSNSCTQIQSEDTAARQIQRAVDCVAQSGSGAGKEVRVYAGAYNEFIPTNAASGSAGSGYLLIRPNRGDTVIINISVNGIQLSNAETLTRYIQFGEIGNGFIIQGGTTSANYGIGIRIYGNEFRNAPGDGLHLSGGTNTEVRKNWFHHNGLETLFGLTAHGIYAANDVNDLTIDGNLIEDHGNANGGWGIHVYGGGTGSQIGRVTISNNTVRRIRATGIGCMFQSNTVSPNFCNIYNNTVTNTGGFGGIFVAGTPNSLIANNTLYNNVQGISYDSAANIQMRNNLLSNNGNGIQTRDGGNSATMSNNLCAVSQTGCSSNGTISFVDAGNGDFRLQSGSAAINTGANLSSVFTTDIAGITRVSWDIGAYAFNASSDTAAVAAPSLSPAVLVAHWKFDEGIGTTASDSSGKGNTGTLKNGPVWAAGKVGRALYFDGIDDTVTVADSNSLDMSNAFTISAWVNPASTFTDWRAIVVKNSKYFLFASTAGWCGNGSPSGAFSAASLYMVCQPSALAANSWSYLTLTYNGATLTLYRNGIAVATSTISTTLSADTATLQIGGSQYGEYFKGFIDEVRVYNGALSSTEIQTIYQQELVATSVADNPPSAPSSLSFGSKLLPTGL